MICERCLVEEATAQMTHMRPHVGGRNEVETHNLCERCYRESEFYQEGKSAGWRTYNPIVPEDPDKLDS